MIKLSTVFTLLMAANAYAAPIDNADVLEERQACLPLGCMSCPSDIRYHEALLEPYALTIFHQLSAVSVRVALESASMSTAVFNAPNY